MSSFKKHIYTIYLFTASDFKTIVIPKTALGTFNALSGPILSTNRGNPTIDTFKRIPLVFLWAWINIFPFNINNQRQPEAVLEDRVNKAWRPMPSGRISYEAATRTMTIAYASALLQSWYLDALLPSAVLLALGFSYNNLGGADRNCILRNLHNAGLYLGFAIGTTLVACGGSSSLNNMAWIWFGVIGLTVFLTVHMQDIPDQEGDRLRGRKSVPLVIGDGPARWTIAVAMSVCSIALPTFWQLGVWGYCGPVAIGGVVVWRVLAKRCVEEDEITWKLWNGWILSLYTLPYIKSLG